MSKPIPQSKKLLVYTPLVLAIVGSTMFALGADRRARPPTFKADQFKDIFFDDISQAVKSPRPSAWEMRGVAPAPVANSAMGIPASAVSPGTSAAPGKASGWASIIQPSTLEDEIKRIRLRYDETVTTPAAFKSGGFQDARRDLTVLASFFAIIAKYPSQVRWKDDAGAARDLLARTASNCKAGSPQVYNEAKLRKQDLLDLTSGTGLANREAAEDVEWGSIADRVPMMQYLDEIVNEKLKELTSNDTAVAAGGEEVIRCAEAAAAMAEILIGDGMDLAADEDYRKMSNRMKDAALATRDAATRKDPAAARTAVGALGQSCDVCHEQYR